MYLICKQRKPFNLFTQIVYLESQGDKTTDEIELNIINTDSQCGLCYITTCIEFRKGLKYSNNSINILGVVFIIITFSIITAAGALFNAHLGGSFFPWLTPWK